MTVDIVMPTYNNVQQLVVALSALAVSEMGAFTVLVCVDGSTDDTLEYLAQTSFPFSVRVLNHADGKNHGRAAARNLALPHLVAEFTLMLDSDMRLAPDGLGHHIELLSRR